MSATGIPRAPNPVTTIVASAGTGKTHTLVERIRAAILGEGVRPGAVLATTFTNRAADELAGRIRTRLIEAGRPELATQMLTARIGTVNAVAGALVAEFALELGRSPSSEVIAEDRVGPTFAEATGPVMYRQAETIAPLAERFEIPSQGYHSFAGGTPGWRDQVHDIVDTARANGIGPDELQASADHSVTTLMALLPEPASSDLDAALEKAVRDCHGRLTPDVRARLLKTTEKARDVVDECMARIDREAPLRWIDWARLAKLNPAKTDVEWFDEVTRVAGQHPRHPRLRRDLEAYVRAVFACARDCMAAFHDHKTERGLLDFVDQEALALQVVNDPANHARLREAIEAVFVDEFQDSSPIQLALFAALARVARQSVWVGDPKQSIYAFRDAAPELTLRAARGITERSGGERAFLAVSYRARPPLTEFVNAAFGPSFATAGFAREEVAFDACHRPEPEGAAPAFACWEVGERNAELRTARLASHVADVVGHAGAWPIEAEGGRPARGGDVAVLCRTNTAVGALASALAARGLRVSVERGGLMHQPEVELALAALRWVADRSDTVAAAELARLAGEAGAWLEVAFAEDASQALGACVDFAEMLEDLRDRTPSLTPAEALDAVLNIEGLLAIVRGWQDAEARFSNLEALRAVAEEYQSAEHAIRRAVTLQGLCNWLMDAGDASQPKSTHPDAVHVLTYHGAKGLQWPIVVLTDLEAEAKAGAFGVKAEGPAEPDPADPLAHRVVRFWPWPYGAQKKDVGLDETAAASPQGRRAARDELLERRRLLYVGSTRAQDYLVLARDERKNPTWLDELQDADGVPLVRIGDGELVVGGQRFATRTEPRDDEERTEGAVAGDEFGPPPSPRQVHRPKHLTPSTVQAQHTPRIVETVRLGDRIPFAGRPDMQALGEACHGFFAWDRPGRSLEARLARARAMLDAWGVTSIAPEDLIGTSDRLSRFLGQRYPNASLQHEVPVFARLDGQLVSGRLDLVVDAGDEIAIVDHKSLPLWLEGEEARLRAFAAQIDLYRRAVTSATDRRCTESWLHQPITGAMSRVELAPSGRRP